MIDQYGRKIDYLRISITDRCNLRCVYCMPETGISLTPHEAIMSFDEITRICEIAADMGFTKIKITGGEPLVRKNAVALVRAIKGIERIEKVTLTTNGVLLGDVLEELVECQIDGINVSLDANQRAVYEQITLIDAFDKVKENILKILEYPAINLKINCVAFDGNRQNLIEMAKLARDYNVHVRFIEMMPIGYGKNYQRLEEATIVEFLSQVYGEMKVYDKELGNGPSHYYQIEGFKGKIGFISALSHRFCETCNRVRLTSQGFLKTCLQYETGVDLRALLRNGADDQTIKEVMTKAISEKPSGHAFLTGDFTNDQENELSMDKIGG